MCKKGTWSHLVSMYTIIIDNGKRRAKWWLTCFIKLHGSNSEIDSTLDQAESHALKWFGCGHAGGLGSDARPANIIFKTQWKNHRAYVYFLTPCFSGEMFIFSEITFKSALVFFHTLFGTRSLTLQKKLLLAGVPCPGHRLWFISFRVCAKQVQASSKTHSRSNGNPFPSGFDCFALLKRDGFLWKWMTRSLGVFPLKLVFKGGWLSTMTWTIALPKAFATSHTVVTSLCSFNSRFTSSYFASNSLNFASDCCFMVLCSLVKS